MHEYTFGSTHPLILKSHALSGWAPEEKAVRDVGKKLYHPKMLTSKHNGNYKDSFYISIVYSLLCEHSFFPASSDLSSMWIRVGGV